MRVYGVVVGCIIIVFVERYVDSFENALGCGEVKVSFPRTNCQELWARTRE